MDKRPWQLKPEEEDVSSYRHFELVDLEQVFAANPDAKVINSDCSVTKNLAKDMTDIIFSNCDGDLGFVPSCQCGNTKGVSKLGLRCPLCETEVTSRFVDSISHNTWISIPNDFPPVLHPVVYIVLREFVTENSRKKGADGGLGKYSVIDAFLNPSLESKKSGIELSDELKVLLAGKRGFDYFYEHVDEMLDIFLHKYSKNAKKKQTAVLEEFLRKYRHLMFTRKLPLLHSSLHPVTSKAGRTLKYIDSNSGEVMKALITLNNCIDKMRRVTMSMNAINKSLYTVYTQIIEYYTSLVDNKKGGKLGGKPGMLRKHCFGSRLHFTYRAVVKPQSTPMPLDELVMPWGIMLTELKLPILNYLVHQYGLSASDAYDKYQQALTKYDKDIDACIRQFIDTSRHGRIPVIMGRNPTIAYGSVMLLYVRDYKTDVHDETIEVNACIVGPLNMDFDGRDVAVVKLGN